MEDIKATVAKQIASLRTQNGWTQLELAEKLHYSDKAVSKWERGESLPELSTLVALADLFEVSLDALVRGATAQPETPEHLPAAKRTFTNHALVASMSILLVWFVASAAFVLFDIIGSFRNHWLFFVGAVPVSAIVWLVFNSIWFNKKRNYLIISLLTWTLLATIHVSLIAFSMNVWQIYLLGIPGQLIILLWSRIRRRKSEKPA